MESLVRARGATKSKLTVFKNYITKALVASSDPSQPLKLRALEIRERINHMRGTYNKYDEIQSEIDK